MDSPSLSPDPLSSDSSNSVHSYFKEEEEYDDDWMSKLAQNWVDIGGSPSSTKCPDSNFTDSDEEDDWTVEDEQLYTQQLASSDGFDVELPARSASFFGMIGPMDINEKNPFIDFQSAAELAIEAYNSFEDRKSGVLQFVKVSMCMGQVCAFMKYYITFEAKDLSTDQVGTYQAIIFEDIGKNMEVLSFRPKPSDEVVSQNLPKVWAWHQTD